MNEKITLPQIIASLSTATGDSRKQTEDFVREFFSLIQGMLAAGESVKIPQIGVFKIVEVEERKSVDVTTGEETVIPAHRKVAYTPSKSLAEEVNEPFGMFETVELTDGYDGVSLSEAPTPDEDIAEEEQPEVFAEPHSPAIEEEIPTTSDLSDSTIEVDEVEVSKSEYVGAEVLESEEEISPEHVDPIEMPPVERVEVEEKPVEVDSQTWQNPPKNRTGWKFLLGFASGVALSTLICLGGYILYKEGKLGLGEANKPTVALTELSETETRVEELPAESIYTPEEENSLEENVSGETVPTAPSDEAVKAAEVVYDTISHTRFLTTMAKAHYGNYNLWPYIYKENESFLGHPDRIRPGTRVVVPPLSKYGVDPKNEADIAKAKKLGVEIYARYK